MKVIIVTEATFNRAFASIKTEIETRIERIKSQLPMMTESRVVEALDQLKDVVALQVSRSKEYLEESNV